MRIKNFWILMILTVFFYGCCTCTEMGCVSTTSPQIRLEIDLDKHPSLEPEDIENLTVFQLNEEWEMLDSIESGFVPLAFEGSEYYLVLDVFNSDTELQDFNYVIRNNELNQLDTISQISYETVSSRAVCNECTGGVGCDDEFYTLLEYINPVYFHNGSKLNSFEMEYIIK